MSNAAPIQDLAVIDATAELVVRRPPALVLEEAHKAAVALKDVIDKKPKKVVLNGEQYLEFEDWQTIARFYGITVKVLRTEQVKYGDVQGFTAYAVALRSDGFELSAAEADCLNDEEKWRSRARYEWQDGKRVKVGEEPVPLFQLKSMAQTRACAKAFRNVLAWVVVLAGYRATPAEELEGVVEGEVVKGSGKPAERQAATPSAGQHATGAQASAPLAPGVTTVKGVTVKTGTNSRGPWTSYRVEFADGRKGSTFGKTLGEACLAAKASGEPVNPQLQQTEKGHDLLALQPTVEASRPLEPVVRHEPDEPVDGPEQVLTARKITRSDQTVYYVIQTKKRVLYTNSADLANLSVNARKESRGVVPSFELAPWPGVEGKVSVLKSLAVEKPAPAEAHEVDLASEIEEPAEREPGGDD